jgi:hypothetical protein
LTFHSLSSLAPLSVHAFPAMRGVTTFSLDEDELAGGGSPDAMHICAIKRRTVHLLKVTNEGITHLKVSQRSVLTRAHMTDAHGFAGSSSTRRSPHLRLPTRSCLHRRRRELLDCQSQRSFRPPAPSNLSGKSCSIVATSLKLIALYTGCQYRRPATLHLLHLLNTSPSRRRRPSTTAGPRMRRDQRVSHREPYWKHYSRRICYRNWRAMSRYFRMGE